MNRQDAKIAKREEKEKDTVHSPRFLGVLGVLGGFATTSQPLYHPPCRARWEGCLNKSAK
jgi:hypothetical protein